MATIQQLLDDINLRYRNTFTTDQKLVWMNEEQRILFETFQMDSAPFAFQLVTGNYLYPIPEGVEIEKIKAVTVQVNDKTPASFQEIPFKRNDDHQEVFATEVFYTIIENNFYLNLPWLNNLSTVRSVYIFCDKEPVEIQTSSLAVEPSVPKRYQEVLKLGTLKRIALARKDIDMSNNYDAEREQLLMEYEWQMKMSEPEFVAPVSTLPRRR